MYKELVEMVLELLSWTALLVTNHITDCVVMCFGIGYERLSVDLGLCNVGRRFVDVFTK